MGKSIMIRTDESLAQILERVRKDIAIDLKKKYNLNEITVPGTFASQVLAAKHRGQRVINFNIRKVGLNKGFIEFI